MTEPRKSRKAAGGPTFCWHCNANLQRAPGKGMVYFHLVRGDDGGGG